MNVLIKRCIILKSRQIFALQSVSYSQKWPDDKWVIMNQLRRFGNWWQSKLENMDNYCGCLNQIYPDMPPKTETDNKLEKVQNNLQPKAVRYWCSRMVCFVRGKVVSIQSMDWHVATHAFIMTNLRKGISTTKSFLERHLLDEVTPATSDSALSKRKRDLEGPKRPAECPATESANTKASNINETPDSKAKDVQKW